jgi:hypothetical protein
MMRMQSQYFVYFLCVGFYFWAGCGKGNKSLADYKAIDLGEHGIPLVVKAPEGTTVIEDTTRENVQLVEKKLILKGEGYHIRVEKILKEYSNPSQNPETVKTNRLNLERKLSHKGSFDDVELEEPNGFVYSTQLPPRGKTYHFFYCTFKNGSQYEVSDYFTVSKQYTENEIRLMYLGLKQEE